MRLMILAAVGASVVASMPAWGQNFEDCLNFEALLGSNPARALTACRNIAEQGSALGQANLGLMYHEGKGILWDQAGAVMWFRKAAEQGLAKAQFNLGVMYDQGQGVSQDYVQAHLWLSLAAAQGLGGAQSVRDLVAARMTPDQIAEAQRLASGWRPKPSR